MKKIKIVNNVKDGIKDASTFLMHDISEISSMQGSSFFNIEKFVSHSIKKAGSEMEKVFSVFFPRSKITNQLIEIGEDATQEVSEISSTLGHTFERQKYNISINPITNLKDFSIGIRDFTMSAFVQKEGSVELEEAFVYHPTTNDFLQFKNNTTTVNEKKFVKRQIRSAKDAIFGVSFDEFKEMRNLPKIISCGKSVLISSDKYCKLIDFLSNKIDFFIRLKYTSDDDFMIQILKKSGYAMHAIKKDATIDFENETIKENFAYIISSRENFKILKSLQDKIVQI